MTDERDQRRRASLVEAHRAAYTGWLEAVADLPGDAWSTATGCPGWDVADQLAHVVSVERALLGDEPDEVELPGELPHVRNEFGQAVEVGVQARRGRPPRELLDEAREVFDRRLAALEAMDAADLGEPMDGPGGMRLRGAQLLRNRVFDLVAHEQDVRRAVGRPGGLDGPHVRMTVETVVRAWGATLPHRLDGGAARVEIDGGEQVTFDLGTGEVHRDGKGPEPAVVIGLDTGALIAVAGGRTDAPDAAQLRVEGDARLAERFLAAAAVTP